MEKSKSNDAANFENQFENFPDYKMKERATLNKFSKDIFISSLSVVNYEEKDSHVWYVVRVEGRTKYLIDLQQAQQLGLY
jgi:hypothetical protein